MTISMKCSNCGRPYKFNDDKAGRRMNCRDCGEENVIRRPKSASRKSKSKFNVNKLFIVKCVVAVAIVVAAVFIVRAIVNSGAKKSDKDKQEEALIENRKHGKQYVALMTEYITTLESVRDREAARRAAPRLNELADELEELYKNLQSLPKLDKEGDKIMAKEFESELQLIKGRLNRISPATIRNSLEEPAYRKAVQRIQKLMKDETRRVERKRRGLPR